MIPISLSLKYKKVCVIGGGKVALRKVKQFLLEDAKIVVVSPSFLPEFNDLNIHCIHDEYSMKYIKDMFMVYAATNDKKVNETVVQDCQEFNVLCGSATYSEDATFYSMSTYKHDLAMIALSTYQKLPYSKPLLEKMSQVLDDSRKRIELLENIRPYILDYVEDTKSYFEKLMSVDIKNIEFLYQSIINQQGVFFVYHHSDYQENFQFIHENSLVISLKEFEEIKDLFVYPVAYKVVPLVLDYGYIYHKIESMINSDWQICAPLMKDRNDIKNILSLYQDDECDMIYIIHPGSDKTLKRKIQDELQDRGKVYDFTEYMMLLLEKKYKVVFLLMTHGKHYHDLIKKMNYYQSMSYQLEYSDVLLENREIREYIEKRL